MKGGKNKKINARGQHHQTHTTKTRETQLHAASTGLHKPECC